MGVVPIENWQMCVCVSVNHVKTIQLVANFSSMFTCTFCLDRYMCIWCVNSKFFSL